MSQNEFSNIYCCSLIESKDRQENIKRQFLEYNIKKFYILLSKRFEESNDTVCGDYINYLDDGTKGAVISHLKMIKIWYDTTDEEYGFFCEDDLSFETVKYWNFTWEDFVNNLPENWDCIQLLCCGENLSEIKLRRRYWNDWSVGAYIITRKYAKILIDSYVREDKFILQYPKNDHWAPLAENLIYYSPETIIGIDCPSYNIYTFPLFVEDITFSTTFFNRNLKDMGVDIGRYFKNHKDHHLESYYKVIEWWKTIGKNLTIGEILKI